MLTIPDYAMKCLTILESNGFEAYLVGGCVRDFLMSETPNDFDITTNALPSETIECFKEYKVVRNGEKHGTVAVIIDGKTVEITTYRIDGDYSDSRHPQTVTFSRNLYDDLSRRDFTINAMTIDKDGEIIDAYNGKKDIENRIIRTVGNPSDRFEEDALRIMRAVRFASQLGFAIDDETSKQIHNKAYLLKNISFERIRDEFVKLICGQNAVEILRQYSDVIEVFIPEIKDIYGFLQHTPYHKYDVWEHTLHAIEIIPPTPILRVTMLLHDIAKPECFTLDVNGQGHFKGHASAGAVKAENILKRLRFSSKETKVITALIENHRNSYKSDYDVLTKINKIGTDNFKLLLDVKKADDGSKGYYFAEDNERIEFAQKRLEEIIANGECCKISDLEISGTDLIKIGFCGSEIGKTLNILLDKVFNKIILNKRSDLLDCANSLKKYGK